MKKTYHIVNREEKNRGCQHRAVRKVQRAVAAAADRTDYPSRIAVDEVISSVGRNTIETI